VGARVVLLPGDCIGPEVAAQARRVLDALPLELEVDERPFGAGALRETGEALPDATLAACRDADAVLKAPIGHPDFDGAAVRPEQGLMKLRSELDVYANLRPAAQADIDLLIVRELVSGIYYGASGTREDGTVFDTCEYHPSEVERIARKAFAIARTRGSKLASVDKANVLETSRMWRRVVTEVSAEFEDVELEHILVDNAAMQLVQFPQRFDVMVCDNMFGDILSDEAAAMTGGLGLAASASLGDSGPGIFEPVHGSAPDIAGQGIANPAAMLRTVSLMLAHGLDEHEQAEAVDAAVTTALDRTPTPDLGGSATTAEFGDAVVAALS